MRRTERLFAIAEVLRGRRTGITAEQLADRFGVSMRTIYRDLDALRSASIPIIGERGRGGGLALDKSYSLPPVNFTPREAAILVAAGSWLLQTRLMPFIDTLRSAIDKVQGAMPTAAQRKTSRLVSTLTWIGVPAQAPSSEVRAAVEHAWVHDLPLRIAYDGKAGLTERRVKLQAVLLERSMTLLNCEDLDKSARRQFRLHQIRRAEVLTADGLTPAEVGLA